MQTDYTDSPDLGGALYDDCGNCIRVWWRDHHDRRYWNATLDLRRLILDDFGTLVPVAP